GAATHAVLDADNLDRECARAERFVGRFSSQQARYQSFFSAQRRRGNRVAFLGAGHLSCAMINYFELKEHVDFVVDDHPGKKGLFMPGSRLPIVGAEALVQHGIKLCCMSVRPEIEDRVIEKNDLFQAQGGVLASIFPDSRYALAI